MAGHGEPLCAQRAREEEKEEEGPAAWGKMCFGTIPGTGFLLGGKAGEREYLCPVWGSSAPEPDRASHAVMGGAWGTGAGMMAWALHSL